MPRSSIFDTKLKRPSQPHTHLRQFKTGVFCLALASGASCWLLVCVCGEHPADRERVYVDVRRSIRGRRYNNRIETHYKVVYIEGDQKKRVMPDPRACLSPTDYKHSQGQI